MALSAGKGIALGGREPDRSGLYVNTINTIGAREAKERAAKNSALDDLLKDFKVDYSNTLPYWANKKRDIVAGFVHDYMVDKANGTATPNQFYGKWQTEILPKIAVIEAGNARAQALVKAANDPQAHLNINPDVINTITSPKTTDAEIQKINDYAHQGYTADTQGGFDWQAVPKPDLESYGKNLKYNEIPLAKPKPTGVPGTYFVGTDAVLDPQSEAALKLTIPQDPYLRGQVKWDRKDLANDPAGFEAEVQRRADEWIATKKAGTQNYQVVTQPGYASQAAKANTFQYSAGDENAKPSIDPYYNDYVAGVNAARSDFKKQYPDQYLQNKNTLSPMSKEKFKEQFDRAYRNSEVVKFLRTDAQANTPQPLVDDNNNSIYGRPLFLKRPKGSDGEWKLAVQLIDETAQKGDPASYKIVEVPYKGNNKLTIEGEYTGFKDYLDNYEQSKGKPTASAAQVITPAGTTVTKAPAATTVTKTKTPSASEQASWNAQWAKLAKGESMVGLDGVSYTKQ